MLRQPSWARRRRPERGVALLEILVSMLVFAIGVLGLVGLQAAAVRDATQTRYRSEATLLVNELLARMRVANRSPASLQAQFGSADNGTGYQAWRTLAKSVLPGVDSFPPIVVVTSQAPLPSIVNGVAVASALPPSAQVQVTLRWKPPGVSDADPASQVVVVSEIK